MDLPRRDDESEVPASGGRPTGRCRCVRSGHQARASQLAGGRPPADAGRRGSSRRATEIASAKIEREIDMSNEKAASLDARIAALTSLQHGVITRRQLVNQGLTRSMVDIRVNSRRLVPMHHGVYRLGSLVGPLEPPLCRVMAAVLACGPGAVASHLSAGVLWRLLRAMTLHAAVHVTIAAGDRGRRPGIRRHRARTLGAEDVAVVDGVPVTAPARTLVDLAGGVRARTLEQAIAEAERLDLVDRQALAAALSRAPHSKGATLMRKLIADDAHVPFTRSSAEEQFLALARRADLPLPETNVRVGEYEVDFLWRSERVVVEVDGFTFHSSRPSFETDRQRDARLAVMGFRVVRVTWRQLTKEPHAVLVRLARLLGPADPAAVPSDVVA
jgi:very-short-patch-repair endonuclease